MRKIFLILIFLYSFVNAEYISDLTIDASKSITGWDFESPQCYGDFQKAKDYLITVQIKSTIIGKFKDNNFTNSYLNNPDFYKAITNKFYDNYPCLGDNGIDYNYSNIGDTGLILYYSESDDSLNTDNLPYIYQRVIITNIEKLASCENTPENNILGGLSYQGLVSDDSSCEIMFNDSGDETNYLYSNTNLDDTCPGFCYFNLPDDTDTGNDDNSNGDNSNNDNTDTDTNTDNNSNNGETTDLSELIPYIDEIEEKNQNIINSLDTLNTNLNTEFNKINNNNQNLNLSMQNLDTTLQNFNTTLQNNNSSSQEDNNNSNNDDEDNFDGIADDFEINPNIDSELAGFRTDIESSLSSSFDTYSNIFGLSGYGYAPASITFSLFGRTYTIFDISYLDSYIEHIRNIFAITAYIFGLFLVFRGN